MLKHSAWEDEKIVGFLSGGWGGGLRVHFFELLPALPLPEAGVDPFCVVWGRLPACSFCVPWPPFGFRCVVPTCC
jgi:hypothetical protein